MTFQYEVGDLEIKRLFKAKRIEDDRFSVKHGRRKLAEVDYPTARALWLGRVELADVLAERGQ